jgi:predicted nucleic-acid-binding Zn-ribbon protein
MKPMTMKFKCSKCGSDTLEEITVNVTQSTEITGVDEDGLLIYGNSSTEGGELDHFQCQKCGMVIKGKQGTISTLNGLADWLKELNKAGKE